MKNEPKVRYTGFDIQNDRTGDRPDNYRGGLIGLLIGDALGVPYEFKAPDMVPAIDAIEFTPPDNYPRSHNGTPPGTWSDDGAQALCLLESLIVAGRLDVVDFAKRMLSWLDHGHLAVDGRVFDVGVTTSMALSKLRRGDDPVVSGLRGVNTNGNGSLMRALPVALWSARKRRDQDDGRDVPADSFVGWHEIVHMAHAQSAVTHAHPRAQVCCALYTIAAVMMLEWPEEHSADPFPKAARILRAIYESRPFNGSPFFDEFAVVCDFIGLGSTPRVPPSGSGYVLDSLCAARVILAESSSYEEAVKRAILLGGDTDTTAAIVGGLAGIRWGAASIPRRWRFALRDRKLADRFAALLLDVGTTPAKADS